jgi:hypothetical protein
VLHEPIPGQFCYFIESPRFLEEMRGPWDDDQLFGAAKFVIGCLIQRDYGSVISSDNEQCGGLDEVQVI